MRFTLQSRFAPILLLCCLAASSAPAETLVPASGARLIPIAADGWAGSSINVIAGLQSTLATHGNFQYAGYYDAEGALVLAKRRIGSSEWTRQPTGLRGDVADAHCTLAIGIDGEGYLHLAWDHHNDPLRYARSVEPGSLELARYDRMIGSLEDSVTYPSFLRMPDGDLLFLYRDGGSGRGNLVLNRYDAQAGSWSRISDRLVDGEGSRSAYVSAVADQHGWLHLAWVWRETPDVATNHDLCYARSRDGGLTWESVSGRPLTAPFTLGNSDYAWRIGQNRSLMNPPSLCVDEKGNPYIANYWAPEGSDVPQYQLVHYDGDAWKIDQLTQRTTPFSLSGMATKRPPISRSVIFTRKLWNKPRAFYLAYRDDEMGGKIVLVSADDLASGDWKAEPLTANSVGAWEPSMDTEQWRRFGQLHMLVQNVAQRDGDDAIAETASPSPVASLLWSPLTASFGEGEVPAPKMAMTESDLRLDAAAVAEIGGRVARWQMNQPIKGDPAGWVMAPLYIGALQFASATGDAELVAAVAKRAADNEWKPGPRRYHADDHCVMQAYFRLNLDTPSPEQIAPSLQRLNEVLAAPSASQLQWGQPNEGDRWSWCDALFMAPASWLYAYRETNDRRYLDFMNQEWWATHELLYVPEDGFFARDQSFLDLREPNGRGLYWSRGNGWVVAGLVHTLQLFPSDHPDYPRYEKLYLEMMDAVLAAQQSDGLWRPGLLDPDTHRARESSGSSFYTYAMAWGVNEGRLPRDRFEEPVRRAWKALAGCVDPSGKLEYAQPIGAAPEGFAPSHNEPFAAGAFLLACSEALRLAGN